MQRLTQSEVLNRFAIIHGNAYDYSRVNYRALRKQVEIGCKKHNVFFLQTPEAHMQGQGCFLCGLDKRKSLIYGVGLNDIHIPTRNVSYCKWREMLGRCYSERIQTKHPSYKGCSVCKEWHTYSTFKAWFENPENGYRDGYCLDKDILVKGNKLYSPETCCFVPNEINSLFTNNKTKRGTCPIGVSKQDNGYQAALSTIEKRGIYLGFYTTPEEAFLAYKEAKEAHIKEVATSYYERGEITEKVYNALMNYQVEITD